MGWLAFSFSSSSRKPIFSNLASSNWDWEKKVCANDGMRGVAMGFGVGV
jgi:hypothetical protein